MRKNTIAAILIAVGFLLINVSCVMCIWQPPPLITTYSIKGADLRELKIVLFPDHQSIWWYNDPNNNYTEISLTKMLGTYPDSDKRLYGDDISVEMEFEVLNKYVKGIDPSGHTTFPDKGHVSHDTIVWSSNKMQFQGMWLKEVTNDSNFISNISSLVGKYDVP
jgi:hypothetical protein